MIKAMLVLADRLRSRGELPKAEKLYREILHYCQRRNEPPDRAVLGGLAAILRQPGGDAEASTSTATEAP